MVIAWWRCENTYFSLKCSTTWGTATSAYHGGSGSSLCWGGRVCFEILVIYLYLLAPDPSHLSRRDKTCPVSKSSHLSRRDNTFGSARENFLRSARIHIVNARNYIYRTYFGPYYANFVRAKAFYSQACHTFI